MANGQPDDAVNKFPEGFLWGAATSAFQVEGHPVEFAERCSDWAVWTELDNKIADGTGANEACDFFNRYQEDIDLCCQLNLNSFRLSLNWPALCPNESYLDKLEPQSVEYYRKLLKTLKEKGMTTFVTLFHFASPLWLTEQGGWTGKKTVEAFGKFAELAAAEFGDLVDYWITLNEPLVYAYFGYIDGKWPPGLNKAYIECFKCVRNLLEGHALAYRAIHKVLPQAQVGFTAHWRPFYALRKWSPLDQLSRYLRDYIFNHLFPAAVQTGEVRFPFPLSLHPDVHHLTGQIAGLKGSMDFLGINYYTREISEFRFSWPIDLIGTHSGVTEYESTELGWELYPQGLYYLLTEDIAPYIHDGNGKSRPIFITENGMATMHEHDLSEGDWSLHDEVRIKYLTLHLHAIHEAIAKGANVKGYLFWSLLDNFEWADGLKPRFGLVRVAYPTQERTFRQSAHVYAHIAKSNGLNTRDFLQGKRPPPTPPRNK